MLAYSWHTNFPKTKLGFEIQKTNAAIRISIFEISCVPIFRRNGQLWLFGPKFVQKCILTSKFPKSNPGFGISILKILCEPIFRQNGELWIFGRKSKFQILDLESASLRFYVHQFSEKMDNFDFSGPNLPTDRFWGQNFKSLSLDLESASLRCYVYQFSDKRNKFESLSPNLPTNGFWSQNSKM